jgi:hypothetical protein
MELQSYLIDIHFSLTYLHDKERGTLAPEAAGCAAPECSGSSCIARWAARRSSGHRKLVLENLAYHDLTSGWRVTRCGGRTGEDTRLLIGPDRLHPCKNYDGVSISANFDFWIFPSVFRGKSARK